MYPGPKACWEEDRTVLREAGYYGRMAWGMREVVRTPPLRDWEGQFRAQLKNRETTFLDTV